MFVLLSASFTALGQGPPDKSDSQLWIEVTGTAEKEVIPNEIVIGIVLNERYDNRKKITIEEQEEKLKEALRAVGIDLSKLSVSGADADYVRISWQRKDVLTRKEYRLKVADAATAGKAFQELEKLSITDANIRSASHTKLDSLRKEIKIVAIKAAKNKADYLLAAIGEKTGRPLIIQEVLTDVPGATNYFEESITRREFGTVSRTIPGVITGDRFSYAKSSAVPETRELEFQKIKLRTSIYAKFSILKP